MTVKTKHLPGSVQKIIRLNATVDCDCVFYDYTEFKNYKKHVTELGLKTTATGPEADHDWVSGNLEGILKLCMCSPYLKKEKYDGSYGSEYEAGVSLKFNPSVVNKIQVNDFTQFVDWMGEDFPDFKDGILENDNVKRLYKKM